MNISNYTYLLANPQNLTSEDLAALDLLIRKYPYFQSARALQLKGLKDQDSFLYNDALKLTAAHTTDRDILFQYITSEKFIQNEISQTILQHDDSVNEINVVSENINDEVKEENERLLNAEIKKAEDILNPELFQRKARDVIEKNKEKEERLKDELQTDKPLEFTKSDTHSFSEWLKLTKAKPIDRKEESIKTASKKEKEDDSLTESNYEDTINQEEKERKLQLIDKFIQERPKIIPSADSEKSSHSGTHSPDNPSNKALLTDFAQSSNSLMTETLAKVYLQQKNYRKAIQAYKILILKNPEKSGFFADQIRAIEKLTNTE
ncbi:hypothetical protein [Aequorivita sediminis]|uniref:hypothetical protein n=1 Tax=Aequorivita sediminis TaxID=3073653 RepID=UPI0028A6A84B|nr:hypothetical protein [Aequorivita sp. F6058]